MIYHALYCHKMLGEVFQRLPRVASLDSPTDLTNFNQMNSVSGCCLFARANSALLLKRFLSAFVAATKLATCCLTDKMLLIFFLAQLQFLSCLSPP